MRSARIGARAAHVWCPCPAQATKECLLEEKRAVWKEIFDGGWNVGEEEKGWCALYREFFFSLESFVVLDTEVWYLLFIVSSMLDIFLKVDIIIVGI